MMGDSHLDHLNKLLAETSYQVGWLSQAMKHAEEEMASAVRLDDWPRVQKLVDYLRKSREDAQRAAQEHAHGRVTAPTPQHSVPEFDNPTPSNPGDR